MLHLVPSVPRNERKKRPRVDHRAAKASPPAGERSLAERHLAARGPAAGRGSISGILLSLAAIATGLGPPFGCAFQSVERARAYAERGDHKSAAGVYENVVARDPANPALRLEYAQSLFRAGDLAGAEREATRANALAPLASEPHLLLARVAERRRLYDVALAHFRKAVKLNPDRAGPQLALGTALLRYGFAAEAVKSLELAARRAPDNHKIWNNLALARYRAHQVGPAEQAYLRAIELDDKAMPSILGLGALYVNTKRYAEAVALYQKALKIKPDEPALHVALGHLCVGLLKPREAAAHYAKAGELYLDVNRLDEAVASLQRATRLAPGEAKYRERLRRAMRAAKRDSDE